MGGQYCLQFYPSLLFMDTQDLTFETNYKHAALVQSNCEYLTCVRHNFSHRTEVSRNSFQTLEDYMLDPRCKLNNEALMQLFIELAYFFYACKNYEATPIIDLRDIRVEESSLRISEKRFSLTVWYKIQKASMQEGEAMGNLILLYEHIFKQLEDYLRLRREERDRSKDELDQQQLLQTFRSQFSMLIHNDYFRQNQAHFFLCLEQTNIFYEQSIFYRIKNCSILDFIKIDEARFNHFRVCKVKDESFVIDYSKEKNRGRGEQEVLRAKEKQIQGNICHFFKSINEKNYFDVVSKNQKDQTYRVKFNYTLREREKFAFEEMLQTMQGSNPFRNDSKKLMQGRRQLSQIEYFIEYASEKNHICVKLYNHSIVSNVEASDFLIHQSNILTFDTVNVSIELTEPKVKGRELQKPRKVVTFKGSSAFNVKEPPLQKILLLMDITMIASKIYEPELNISRFSGNSGKDHQRLNTISMKIRHYSKMFLKCAKKVYSE